MPIRYGGPELIILVVALVLLFGVGRIGRLFGELGVGLRNFRMALTGEVEPRQGTEDKDEH